MPTKQEAKAALDKVIRKSRVHFYKPIQIAEILYRDRTYQDIDLSDLESYRTKSKKWRDDICAPLLGRTSTSSAKFQDNLFEDNAVPPAVLNVLGEENRRTGGAVEAYVYRAFQDKYGQLKRALKYCAEASRDTFDVKRFIDSFWNEPGLKRSLDKIYEIVVYALFSTLVEELGLQVTVSVDGDKLNILAEFEDFAQKVMRIDSSRLTRAQDAKIYRVGVTNAADRGLDMYANWGPTIQVKHLSLDVELAESIVENISSDRIIIVCKDAEKDVILSLLSQIGWRSHIQSVVTENNLITWYSKALAGQYADRLGDRLLRCLRDEIAGEFPSVGDVPEALRTRHYETVSDAFWE